MTWLALILVLISVLILPVLWRQLASFVEAFPSYAITLEELISDKAERLSRDYGGILIEKLGLGNKSSRELANATNDLISQATQWVAAFLNSLLTRGAALISLISLLVVTPVVAFYMLLDWEKMITTIDGLVPLRHRETVRELAREIDSGHGGIFARPIACVPLSRRLVWHWLYADRAQFRPFDRHHGRDLELYPLCRLRDSPGACPPRSRSCRTGRNGSCSPCRLAYF